MSNELGKIESALVMLLNDKSRVFYASLILQMIRVEEPAIETAGVGMQDGRIYLYYNPKFIATLTLPELSAIMEHEVMHLIFEHPAREKGKEHNIWDIACDMAINQMIDGLPKGCVFPKDFKLPDGKIAEVYYEALYKQAPKITIRPKGCPKGSPQPCPHSQPGQGQGQQPKPGNQKGDQEGGEGKGKDEKKNGAGSGSGESTEQGQGQGQGNCQGSCPHKGTPQCPASGGGGYTVEIETADGKKYVIDSHEKWNEVFKGDPGLNREGIRQAIKDAFEQTQKNRGFIPGNIESHIKKWLQPPTLSWKQLLRMFVGNTIKTGSKFTWKRTSRRYGSSQKGTIPTRTVKMMIGIDTSGSVGTDDFKEFMAEIRGIMQTYKNETTIIESDAQVQKTYKLKPNQQLDTKFKGRGGTDYEPVFKYLKEKEKDVDLLIYFTDFYCSFPKEKPKFPVLWVVTSQGDKDNKPPWGMTIRIKKASKYGEEEEE